MDHQPSLVTRVLAVIVAVLVFGLAGSQPDLCTALIAAGLPCMGLIDATG